LTPLTPTETPVRTFFANTAARRIFFLLGALLLLSAWRLSCRVAGYDFLALGDDDINVTLNPYLGHLDHDHWAWLLTDTSYVRRFMPFGWLTLCAIFEVNGLDPFFYHSAAFGFYIANVVLVYAVTAHVLRVFARGCAGGLDQWHVFASFLAAGWWAFHPLRVESTAWISGLLYGQGAMFFLIAALAYLRSYMGALRGRSRTLWIAVSLLAITASLLTYPIALGFAFLLFATDYYFVVGVAPGIGLSLRRLAMEKVLFLIPVGSVFLFTALARVRNPAVWGGVPTFADFPLFQRVMQAAYIVAYYVWRPLYPLRMTPITSTLMDFNPWAGVFVLSLALIAAVSAYALISRRTRPWFGCLWLVYLTTVVPFIGFTEHPYYASDRYAYIPSIVIAAVGALGLALILDAQWRRRASLWGLGLIVVLGLNTNQVLSIWAGPAPMFSYLVSAIPPGEEHDRILSRFAMFDYLYGDPAGARAKIDICVRDFPASEEIGKVKDQIENQSGRLAPKGERVPIAFMHSQLGFYFLKTHQPIEAGVQLRRALEFDPALFDADYNLALLEATEGRPRDALHHLLLAEAHAGGALPMASRDTCARVIGESARAVGDDALARLLESPPHRTSS
jgi:hypothetical protein